MKKTLSILLVLVLFCSPGYTMQGRMQGRMLGGLGDTVLEQLQAIGGLTFYMGVSDGANSLDADFSLGSETATFTRTGGATKPATYIDVNGIVNVTTTTGEVRYQSGYYDENGFTEITPESLLESESTNLLVRTDGTASGSGLWTGWTDDSDTAETPTLSQVAIPELTSISGANSQRMVYVDGADAGAKLRLRSTNTGAGTVVNGDLVVLSFWARTQSGVTGAQFESNIRISNEGFVQQSFNTANHTLSSSWARYEQKLTVVDADANRGQIVLGFTGDVDQGDTLDFELWGIQLEILDYPSSFIPTTAAALTRNTEALSYATSKNFVGGTDGSILLKWRAIGLPDELAADSWIFDTNDAEDVWRIIQAQATDKIRFQTESGNVQVNADSATDPFGGVRYSSLTVVVTYSTTADSGGKKQHIYLNGSLSGTPSTDYTEPLIGPVELRYLNGSGQAVMLEAIAFYSKRLSATEVALVDTILE